MPVGSARKRQVILRALDGLVEAAHQFLQVFVAVDEVNVIGIHHHQV
jgi:hypothetical protein